MKRILAAAVAWVLLCSGCGASSLVSNGSVDVCYRAIPVAKGALHTKSVNLIGVHRVAADDVADRLPPSEQGSLAAEKGTTVCALAWHGKFAKGQVEMAPSDQTGDYALVLVSSRHLRLVAAVVLNHLPRAFAGRTL